MHQPGVEARPIKMISGASGQCETFFTDAKASKDDLVGQLNGGWAIAKRLLQHERNGMGSRSEGGPRQAENLGDVAKRYLGVDETGRLADSDLRGRITNQKMDEQALKLTVRRAAAEAKGNANAGVSTTTSIMKNVSMKSAQDRSELLVEIYGHQGLGWEGEAFKPDELSEVRGWLAGKAFSIFGGTHEVQNNIISKRILGLPDPTSGASK